MDSRLNTGKIGELATILDFIFQKKPFEYKIYYLRYKNLIQTDTIQ